MDGYTVDILPYQRLLNAIVIQAANDYISAKKELIKYPHDQTAVSVMQETENFIKSGWYLDYLDISGEYLIKIIEKKVQA